MNFPTSWVSRRSSGCPDPGKAGQTPSLASNYLLFFGHGSCLSSDSKGASVTGRIDRKGQRGRAIARPAPAVRWAIPVRRRRPLIPAIASRASWLPVLGLALSSCSTPVAPTEPLASVEAAPVITPSGAFAIYGYEYGAVLPWHVETAEGSWQRVAPCVGVDRGAVHRFPILLLNGPTRCGRTSMPGCMFGGDEPRIEIIAASWDFDPHQPEASPAATAEIVRLWRHELVHLALWRRDGNLDGRHRSSEWSCESEPDRLVDSTRRWMPELMPFSGEIGLGIGRGAS